MDGGGGGRCTYEQLHVHLLHRDRGFIKICQEAPTLWRGLWKDLCAHGHTKLQFCSGRHVLPSQIDAPTRCLSTVTHTSHGTGWFQISTLSFPACEGPFSSCQLPLTPLGHPKGEAAQDLLSLAGFPQPSGCISSLVALASCPSHQPVRLTAEDGEGANKGIKVCLTLSVFSVARCRCPWWLACVFCTPLWKASQILKTPNVKVRAGSWRTTWRTLWSPPWRVWKRWVSSTRWKQALKGPKERKVGRHQPSQRSVELLIDVDLLSKRTKNPWELWISMF